MGKQRWRHEVVFDAATELVLDIHHGEGGMDSKLFVDNLAAAYIRYATSLGLKIELLLTTEGHQILKIIGVGVWKHFQYEQGSHVVQRVPPTESGGRHHTSVVTVAVLPLPPENTIVSVPLDELEITAQTGHGKGGQNVNKVASAVRIVHKPTGLRVFINGRDQHQNKKEALRIINARVNELRQNRQNEQYGSMRREQWGGGGRGNKIRTYNFIFSRATDHRFGIKTSKLDEIFRKGNFSILMPKK